MTKNSKLFFTIAIVLATFGMQSRAEAAWRSVYTITSAASFDTISWDAERLGSIPNSSSTYCWNTLRLKYAGSNVMLKSNVTGVASGTEADMMRECRTRRSYLNDFLFQIQSLGSIQTRVIPGPGSANAPDLRTPIVYCERAEMLVTVDWTDENGPAQIIGTKMQMVATACPHN